MKCGRSIFFVLSLVLFASGSSAQVPVYRAVIGSIGPIGTTDGTTLRGGNWSADAYEHVTVTCYHNPSGAPGICAGGGDFDRIPYNPADENCNVASGLDNGATLIQDEEGNCFYRKNFGINGVVDAGQCGVFGDGLPHAPSDGALLWNCLKIAGLQAAPHTPNGIAVVNTGGGVILDNDTQLKVPGNVQLTCGGTSPSGSSGNDYRIFKGGDPANGLNITNAIVINPQLMGDAIVQSPIWLPNKSSTIRGCLVEASDKDAFGTVINPYAPSVWYPGCDPGKYPCDDSANKMWIRSAILEYSAFNPNKSVAYPTGGPASASTGILIGTPKADGTYSGGTNSTIESVMVLGFGTCFLGTAAGLIVDNLSGDCDNVINLTDADSPHLSRWSANPELTSGDIAELALSAGPSFEFTNDGAGHYKVLAEMDPYHSDFRVRNGDPVWIAPALGAESATGRWTVQCTETNQICPMALLGCPQGKTCQSFSLQNSVYNIGSPNLSLSNASTAAGSNAVAVPFFDSTGSPLSSALFVAVGQQVTDSQHCIASPSTVTNVWPAADIVYISSNAQQGCTGDTIYFQDNFYSGTPSCAGTNGTAKGCAIVDASFRYGDGLSANNAGGFRMYDCGSFGHQVSFHMNTGSRGDFVNCATGNNVGLPDRNLAGLNNNNPDDVNLNGNVVSLFIEGQHAASAMTGSDFDACEINWTNGVLGQHRTVAVVVQSNCTNPNKFINIGASVDNKGGGGGVALELDAGTVLLANSDSGTGGSIFKASKGTLYDRTNPGTSGQYKAVLNVSNNDFSSAPLFLENSQAAAETAGCGNVFAAVNQGGIVLSGTPCSNDWSQ